MRNKQIFLISFIIYLCTISSVRAGEYHLLPEPQKFTPLGSSFVLGRTKLSTPVLRQEWEAFVVDRGGVIDDKARASIEVKLVPSLEEVPLNADEAYRLVVNNGKVTVHNCICRSAPAYIIYADQQEYFGGFSFQNRIQPIINTHTDITTDSSVLDMLIIQ